MVDGGLEPGQRRQGAVGTCRRGNRCHRAGTAHRSHGHRRADLALIRGENVPRVLRRRARPRADRRGRSARECLYVALGMGQETLIQFYDAELLRLRAHTLEDVEERHRHLRDAIQLARKQGAYIFELRSAADDFELTGEPARAALLEAFGRIPPDQTWPDLARARALLG